MPSLSTTISSFTSASSQDIRGNHFTCGIGSQHSCSWGRTCSHSPRCSCKTITTENEKIVQPKKVSQIPSTKSPENLLSKASPFPPKQQFIPAEDKFVKKENSWNEFSEFSNKPLNINKWFEHFRLTCGDRRKMARPWSCCICHP